MLQPQVVTQFVATPATCIINTTDLEFCRLPNPGVDGDLLVEAVVGLVAWGLKVCMCDQCVMHV
jgi:hypothetical protein